MKKSELLTQSEESQEVTLLTVSTDSAVDVRKALQLMGDSLCNKYFETGDLRAAQQSIYAYAIAINAMKAQFIASKSKNHLK